MLCTIKLACYFLLYEDLQFMNCNQLHIHYRDTGTVIEKRTNICNEDQRLHAKIVKSFLSKNDINSARDFVYKMNNRPRTEYTELSALRPPNNVRARIITFYFPFWTPRTISILKSPKSTIRRRRHVVGLLNFS